MLQTELLGTVLIGLVHCLHLADTQRKGCKAIEGLLLLIYILNDVVDGLDSVFVVDLRLEDWRLDLSSFLLVNMIPSKCQPSLVRRSKTFVN